MAAIAASTPEHEASSAAGVAARGWNGRRVGLEAPKRTVPPQAKGLRTSGERAQLQALRRRRGPDPNRGHHDFQAPQVTMRFARKVLQTGRTDVIARPSTRVRIL